MFVGRKEKVFYGAEFGAKFGTEFGSEFGSEFGAEFCGVTSGSRATANGQAPTADYSRHLVHSDRWD